MTEFRGSGGPPPAPFTSNNNRFSRREYVLQEESTKGLRKVNPFFIKSGEKTQVIMLDSGSSFDFTVRLHTRFKAFGKLNNNVVCISEVSHKGCPLCDVLGDKEPSKWFAAGTLIDCSKWTIPDGKKKGEVVTDQRRLLLINSRQLDNFRELGNAVGNFHGKLFTVSRSTDEKSSRIGTLWIPAGGLTDEQLKERVAKVSESTNIPVETYIKPFDYDKVLAPMPFEEMQKVAKVVDKANSQEPDEEEVIPF